MNTNDKINVIIDLLKNLTLLETLQLVKEIENIFEIDKTVINPVSVNSVITVPNTILPEIVEKTSFDLILIEVPIDKKIAVLKIVKIITGLGLKESKDIVDNVPKVLKEGISKEDSEKFKKEFEQVGAKVVIK